MAGKLQIKTIGMPMISGGMYGVDKELIFNCFKKACQDSGDLNLDVFLVMIDKDDYEKFASSEAPL